MSSVRHYLLRITPLLIGLAGASVLLTGDRWTSAGLWTWRFLHYVGWHWRVGLAALTLAAGLLPVQALIGRLWRRRRAWPAWPLIPVGGLLFWLLRERTYRGDALLKLYLLSTETLRADPYVWKEPADAWLAYTFTGWLRPFGLGPEVAVAIISVLAGMVYLAAVLEASRHLDLEEGKRMLLVIGLLATGSSQLWFGHVENYSLVTAFSMLVAALGLGCLAGRRSLWMPGLAAGAAVSFHPQAVFFLPALLLLLKRRQWVYQLGVLALSGVVVPAVTVVVLLAAGVPPPGLAGGFAGDPQIFWTPAEAMMPARLLDAFSNLWLVAPLLPGLVVAGGLALAARRATADENALRCFYYLTALAVSLLLYHFTFQNDLPRPQDWDLFAIVGPGVTLWGLYAWLRIAEWQTANGRWQVASGSWGYSLLLPALAFAVAVTAAWVGVNHHFTLLQPNADQREIFVRYRLLDLAELLPQAAVTPSEPICTEPASDPTGCQRVTLTSFTMPQDGDARPVIFAHAPAQIALPLSVPAEPCFLWLSPALDPLAWGWGGDGVTFQVRVQHAGRDDLLWARHLAPANSTDRDWQEAFVSLDAYGGQTVLLLLIVSPGPTGDASADRAGWGLPWLMKGTLRE